jgi:hypothetical protein
VPRPSNLTVKTAAPAWRSGALALALALSGVSGACGCAPAFVAQRPYPPPTAAQLMAALRARQQAVRAADLDTRTTATVNGDRTRATVLMLVDRAGRLRFDVEVALHGPVATLATDGRRFGLLDLNQNILRTGGACPENLALLVPVPLRPAEIAAILLGDAPVSADARAVAVNWDGKTRADVLEIENPGAGRTVAERVWVSLRRMEEGRRWDVVGIEARPMAGAGRWRVAFEQLKVEGAWSHPALIRFAEPGRRFEDGVEIAVKNRKLDPPLPPQAFELTLPEGFRPLEHPCPLDPISGS